MYNPRGGSQEPESRSYEKVCHLRRNRPRPRRRPRNGLPGLQCGVENVARVDGLCPEGGCYDIRRKLLADGGLLIKNGVLGILARGADFWCGIGL